MLTNEEFQEKLKIKNPTIKTNTLYLGNDTIMDCQCDKRHKYQTRAFNLIYNINKCPICSGRRIQIGFNDMWTTNPSQAELLWDFEDGYKYSQCSEKKVFWKCPCCGEKIYKRIANVHKRGLICNKCSDGISFPNRFMYNVLALLSVDFKTEYILDNSSYRYDFYIPEFNMIIEMQGRQHYEGWNSKRIPKEKIQQNDKEKKEYALKSGINYYIEIDSREATMPFISQNIVNSKLSDFFDFSILDWNECLLNSIKSFIGICAEYYNQGLSIEEIANKIKFSTSSVRNWLKFGTELNLCNWTPLKGFLRDEKPVILINNQKIYRSISEAAKDTNQSAQNISLVCKRKRKYSGVDISGSPLIWRFLKDYDPDENYENVNKNRRTGTMVNQYSLDNIFINSYKTMRIARETTNAKNIGLCCRKERHESGGFKWFYADDLTQPDKSKIISAKEVKSA